MKPHIDATPHRFPRRGAMRPDSTALLVIDVQHDFVSPGGYMDCMGGDTASLAAPVAAIRRVLDAARAGGLRIAHTREGFAPDLSDVQPWKRAPAGAGGAGIGEPGAFGRALVRGEPGWQIVPELAPAEGEPVFDKAAYGIFAFTGIEAVLREWGVENLVLTGLTTDCCVQSAMRDALDRGYDCLVLEDCVAAASPELHDASLRIMTKESGAFGARAASEAFIAALG
jgi:nicotinamidase-related amidase